MPRYSYNSAHPGQRVPTGAHAHSVIVQADGTLFEHPTEHNGFKVIGVVSIDTDTGEIRLIYRDHLTAHYLGEMPFFTVTAKAPLTVRLRSAWEKEQEADRPTIVEG